MQTDETYDDLTELFAAQDDALQSEAFVDAVMQPVRKRSRWRAPLLFGAGGLGLGAALSQIGDLSGIIAVEAPSIDLSLADLDAAQISLEASSFFVLGLVILIAGCAAIVATERA
ncbi:MAG: hypothetical protein AAFY82_06825 [Pseudomonadota bacterium]